MQLQHTLKMYERVIEEKQEKINALSKLLETQKEEYERDIAALQEQIAEMEAEIKEHRTVCPFRHQQNDELEKKVAALELENTELKKKLGSQHSAEDDKTLAEKADLHARCSDCEQAKEKQRLELERLKAENAQQKQEMERQKAEMARQRTEIHTLALHKITSDEPLWTLDANKNIDNVDEKETEELLHLTPDQLVGAPLNLELFTEESMAAYNEAVEAAQTEGTASMPIKLEMKPEKHPQRHQQWMYRELHKATTGADPYPPPAPFKVVVKRNSHGVVEVKRAPVIGGEKDPAENSSVPVLVKTATMLPTDDSLSKDDDVILDGEPPAATEATPLLVPPAYGADDEDVLDGMPVGSEHLGRQCYKHSPCLAYTALFLLLVGWFWLLPVLMSTQASSEDHLWSVWFPAGLMTNVLLPILLWMYCTDCLQNVSKDRTGVGRGITFFLLFLALYVCAFLIGVQLRGNNDEALRVVSGDSSGALCPSISPHTIPDVTTGDWADGSYVYAGHTGWVLERNTCIVVAPVLAATQQNSTDGCSAVLGDNGTTTIRFWAYAAVEVSQDVTDCQHIAIPYKTGAIIKAADPVEVLVQEALEDWGNVKTQLDTAKSNFFTTGGTAALFVDGGWAKYVEMADDPQADALLGVVAYFSFFAVPILVLLGVLVSCQLYERDHECCCFKTCACWADDAVKFDSGMQTAHSRCFD